MSSHGRNPAQPEIDDPPPSQTEGLRGRRDHFENLPTEGLPTDEGEKTGSDMPVD